MSGFSYKPIKNGSVFVYNPNNFVSTNLITVDQLLTKCYTKSQCDIRFISATGDPALFFLDLYDSATVSNVVDWNKSLRVNQFIFPTSGRGLELAFNSTLNTGLILSYNRDTNTYYDCTINNRFTVRADGKYRFGTTNTNSPATLSIGNVSDNALSLHWDSSGNSYNMLGVDDKGSLHIGVFENLSSRVAQFVMNSRGYMRLNHTTSTYSTLISNVRAPLDFGYLANSCMINLYKQAIDVAPFYGIGANNSAVEYHSPVDHKWYYNSSHTESTLTTTLGTNTMALLANGNLQTSKNITASAGIHAYGFDSTGIAGPGAHMHYGAGTASYFGYNYSTNAFLTTQIGPSVWIHSVGGTTTCGMNVNTAGSGNIGYIAPLAVYGTQAFTKSGAFGFLNSGGASNASNFTNRNFSIYSDNGILVNSGEIDCFSDRRMKRNIQTIDEDTAKRFLTLDPVKFQYNVQDESDPKYYYSFIAQDVVAKNIPHIVGYTSLNGETVLEPETIECEDGSIATIDGETKFTLNLLACVPYLHKIIQMQEAKIVANEAAIQELRSQLGN